MNKKMIIALILGIVLGGFLLNKQSMNIFIIIISVIITFVLGLLILYFVRKIKKRK